MPTTKTAEKEMRLAQKRKDRNKSTRSETKTKVVKAGAAISSGDIDKAKSAVITAILFCSFPSSTRQSPKPERVDLKFISDLLNL